MSKRQASADREAARAVRASCERIAEELAAIVRTLAPSAEVLAHFRAARVEVLKGLRAAIDAQIAQAERRERKGQSVPIE
jgi:hypothetical protein